MFDDPSHPKKLKPRCGLGSRPGDINIDRRSAIRPTRAGNVSDFDGLPSDGDRETVALDVLERVLRPA